MERRGGGSGVGGEGALTALMWGRGLRRAAAAADDDGAMLILLIDS